MRPVYAQAPFPFACQRWRDRRGVYIPPTTTIQPANYEVAPIPLQLAKAFVLQHHYLNSYPACRFRYGLFKHGKLVGAAILSVPQHPAVLTNVFPGDPNASVDLGRFVLLDEEPANSETWFLARCRELLKKEGIVGMVAFSDDNIRPTHAGPVTIGHIGTIYQASNFTYLGRSSPKTVFILPDGTSLEGRTLSKIRNHESGWEYASQKLRDYGADKPWKNTRAWLDYWLPQLTTRFRHAGNHKYAHSLSNSVRVSSSVPYPKRLFPQL